MTAKERPSGPRRADLASDELRLMRFLAQSAEDLNSSLRLEEVFEKIAERISSLIDCSLFAVLLWNEETKILEHSYALCGGERLRYDGGFRLGQGISGTAAVLRRPVLVPDVRKDPNYIRHRFPEVEIRSEFAVPLIARNRLIGVLDLESSEVDAFTREHETMVSALGSHIATALENARLYERMAREERRLEEDLAMAKEIQKGLLPRVPPQEPGLEIGVAYRPATTLGGDFYDFLHYPDGRLAIAVGDVSGKATAAALYGSLAVGILRGFMVEQAHSSGAMLARMNEALLQPMLDNRFVAMAFGIYDGRDRSLVVASAGFPRPFLVRGGKAETVDLAGVPLGLLPEIPYREVRLSLRPGDVVAFCSDGVQEAALGDGDAPISEDRLGELVASLARMPAAEVAQGVLRASDLYIGERFDPPDDRTVVVLKVSST